MKASTLKKSFYLMGIISGLLAVVALNSHAAPRPFPEVVNLIPDALYVPPGFDDNDRAQVVVSGNFMNSCYKAAPGHAKVDFQKMKVTVENPAYYYPTGWCLQVLVPYSQTIELGVLPAGTYDISALDNRGSSVLLGKIAIAKSTTPSPDDFLYAPINDAHIEKGDGSTVLILQGAFGNDCMSLKQVKVITREEKVIEVFPISEVKQGTVCKEIVRPFQTKVKLESSHAGIVLVHIRSLNGQAINKLVDF